MNEQITRDLINGGVRVLTAQSKPSTTVDDKAPRYHKEAWAPGVELDSYTKRVPSEDGTYVLVTEHKERIELIEQPPTPEELEEQKAQRRHNRITGAIVAFGLVGVAGILNVLDHRQVRAQVSTKTAGQPTKTAKASVGSGS